MAPDMELELRVPSTTPTSRGARYKADSAYMRTRRKKLRISQRALGAAVGLTHSALHKIEANKAKTNYEMAKAIAEALGEPLEYLFEVTTEGYRRDA